jgi:hypothetical protein
VILRPSMLGVVVTSMGFLLGRTSACCSLPTRPCLRKRGGPWHRSHRRIDPFQDEHAQRGFDR